MYRPRFRDKLRPAFLMSPRRMVANADQPFPGALKHSCAGAFGHPAPAASREGTRLTFNQIRRKL